MNIAMSGATGFVGGHLSGAFAERGWKVIPLGRSDFGAGGDALFEKIRDADIVVNLAGASIAERWTEAYKKVLYRSRIETTRQIVGAMGKAGKKPGLFISTSAVGIYDSGGVYTERNGRYGDDFLATLCLDWEQAAFGANDSGIRTVIFRFGLVLGPDGGVIRKMLLPFKMGLGGTLGDGKQAFSWVHIDDLVRAYLTVIDNSDFEGVYNLTAPQPTTNKGLTKALANALGRPALMRVPFFMLKLQLGEGAKAVLEGQNVIPERLLEKGFTFRFTEIDKAVQDIVIKAG